MKRILFVDDETNILQGIRRMLRSRRNEWDMQFAESGADALECMTGGAFDVVISDMQMPGMDGAELLTKVQEQYPDTVRIVLSGHAEKEAVLRSVRCTHQFLSKPCDADTLLSAIEKAFALRDRLEGPRVQELVSRIEDIPAVPALYQQVTEELQSEDCSLQTVAQLVEQDAGMSVSLLKLVNSAYFGLASPIAAVDRAVSFVGLETLTSLILSVPLLDPKDCAIPRIAERVWSQSLPTAVCAKKIMRGEGLDKKAAEDAFLAGMMHDIGQVILATNFPRDYEAILKESEEESRSVGELERSVFGASHGDIGGYLLGLWGLPDPIVEAVTYHEDPIEKADEVVTARGIVRSAAELIRESDGEVSGLAEELQVLGAGQTLENWRATALGVVDVGDGAS